VPPVEELLPAVSVVLQAATDKAIKPKALIATARFICGRFGTKRPRSRVVGIVTDMRIRASPDPAPNQASTSGLDQKCTMTSPEAMIAVLLVGAIPALKLPLNAGASREW
jgi:hypothetical protein